MPNAELSSEFLCLCFKVYNGNSSNSALLKKLCGPELPPPIRSTASDVYVKLRTDNIMSYSGFLATYKQSEFMLIDRSNVN